MKSYSISRLPGDLMIDFDALPVAKITHYPHETHDYKPYAQVCVGLNRNQLALQLCAFELDTGDYSSIVAVLFINKAGQPLELEVTPISTRVELITANSCNAVAHKQKHIAGEDLQGVFWGQEITIDIKELEKYGELALSGATNIAGNFFKTNKLSDATLHIGAFDLAALNNTVVYSKEAMCSFKLTDY